MLRLFTKKLKGAIYIDWKKRKPYYTKKHYDDLKSVFINLGLSFETIEGENVPKKYVWGVLSDIFLNTFRADNPKFDHKRFQDQLGIYKEYFKI